MNENRDRESYFDPFAVERPARKQQENEKQQEQEPKQNQELVQTKDHVQEERETDERKDGLRYRRRTERFVTFSIRRDILAMLRTVQAVLQLTGRPKSSMNDLLHGFTSKCVRQDYPEAWHLIESRMHLDGAKDNDSETEKDLAPDDREA